MEGCAGEGFLQRFFEGAGFGVEEGSGLRVAWLWLTKIAIWWREDMGRGG